MTLSFDPCAVALNALWPAYKNHEGPAGGIDNAYFATVPEPATMYSCYAQRSGSCCAADIYPNGSKIERAALMASTIRTSRQLLAPTIRLCCLLAGCCLGVEATHGADSKQSAASPQPAISQLWGLTGEQWEPAGRLPDYSYAGYHRGERPLPTRRADVSVRRFGAVGDGQTDDTGAIQRALREAPGKVIAFPPGRYMITDVIEIRHPGTVLQGAGPEQTVLYIPKPLEKIRSNLGATTAGRVTSNYSWSGGIVSAKGKWSGKLLSRVTASAARGARRLTVERPDRFKIGDEIRLTLLDPPTHSLTHHLYAGDPGDIGKLHGVREHWIARVVEVDQAAKILLLDRPLRTEVRSQWKPMLAPAHSTAEEIGIEHLAFEFPVTPYQGHFTELGYNAIAFSQVRNCWVHNIEIHHADSGLFLSGSNTTISNIVWSSDRRRDGARNSTGHHGIILGGSDQLLKNFDFRTKFIHDITMTRQSAGNVVCRGRGEDLTFDHHKYANHSNLYTDIDAGVGTNIFRSGGGAQLGRHCGAWTTWWNIRTQRPVDFPTGWATHKINLVGVPSQGKSLTSTSGPWFETMPPERLVPTNLYDAQLQRRFDASHAAE